MFGMKVTYSSCKGHKIKCGFVMMKSGEADPPILLAMILLKHHIMPIFIRHKYEFTP